MSFYCTICGKHHSDFPAIACKVPDYYLNLPREKQVVSQVSEDFCIIDHGDQVDHFIRTVIAIPVIGIDQKLDYGLWVSLSERNFKHYYDHFNGDSTDARYFGYISNRLPGYPNTLLLKTDVVCGGTGERPHLVPHRDRDNHPFVDAFYQGVTLDFALERLHEVLDKHTRQ